MRRQTVQDNLKKKDKKYNEKRRELQLIEYYGE